MEAATLSLPAARPSFERPGRCEASAAREREPRTCVDRRRSSCGPGESYAATLRYRRSERTVLYVETREGDVVRLKIEARSALHAEASAPQDETTLDEFSVTARNALKLRFSVDGHLDPDELAAVRNVLAQATELAAEFFAGAAPEAFAAAASLDIDGAQLTHVGLRFSVREHGTYSASGNYRSPAAPLPALPLEDPAAEAAAAPSAAPAESAVEEAPAPAHTAPAAPSANAGEAAATSAEPAEPPTDIPPVPAAAPDLASAALRTIGEFVAQLLDSLSEPPPASARSGGRSDLSLKLRAFQFVVLTLAAARVPAAGDSPSGVPLLGETLDALAEHERPLDATA